MESAEKLIAKYKKHAKENGFRLNPDKKIIANLIAALLKREKEFGEKYCPCRRISGSKEKDKKIICPCIYHKKEIEKDGRCICNLFVKN